MLRQRIVERTKNIVALGRHRALPAQGQCERSDIAVAARQGHELGIDRLEPVERGCGRGELRPCGGRLVACHYAERFLQEGTAAKANDEKPQAAQ